MAISYKKDEKLESLFASFAKLPDNVGSDPKKGKKDNEPKESDNTLS
ncbi:SPJ_0845 family protein [Streptococcus halotolerans]|nr:SPJ_0845 family protein [Streptococcus halotolerans]